MPKKRKILEDKKPEEKIAEEAEGVPTSTIVEKAEISGVEKREEVKVTTTSEPETDKKLTEKVKEKIFAVKPKLEIPKEEKKKPSGTVKVKVLVGTLQFEDGIFQKGDVFTVSKERVKLFDPRDIEILK